MKYDEYTKVRLVNAKKGWRKIIPAGTEGVIIETYADGSYLMESLGYDYDGMVDVTDIDINKCIEKWK